MALPVRTHVRSAFRFVFLLSIPLVIATVIHLFTRVKSAGANAFDAVRALSGWDVSWQVPGAIYVVGIVAGLMTLWICIALGRSLRLLGEKTNNPSEFVIMSMLIRSAMLLATMFVPGAPPVAFTVGLLMLIVVRPPKKVPVVD